MLTDIYFLYFNILQEEQLKSHDTNHILRNHLTYGCLHGEKMKLLDVDQDYHGNNVSPHENTLYLALPSLTTAYNY